MANDKIGSVMVIGGGIGGMQAALDLAESGYLVYLVEKDSAIGGRMAQLDKTFPTNDCSMCIMGPKLVECGRWWRSPASRDTSRQNSWNDLDMLIWLSVRPAVSAKRHALSAYLPCLIKGCAIERLHLSFILKPCPAHLQLRNGARRPARQHAPPT